jgi:protein AroM
MSRVLGAVTIGQSPRTDLIPELREILGAGAAQSAEVIEAGALDGLTLEQVREMAPVPGDYVLVTRMADGTAVKIAERHILPLMQEKIDGLVERGADCVALVCTGEFPQFRCDKLLIMPQKVLYHVTAAVVRGQTTEEGAAGPSVATAASSRLGVLLPDADQVAQGIRRWSAVTPYVRIEPASPYDRPEVVEDAAHRLREWRAGVAVMDCIGYTMAMKEKVRGITGVPVILARSILARVLAELA